MSIPRFPEDDNHTPESLAVLLEQRGLPPLAFRSNEDGSYGASPTIAIKRGEYGYWPVRSRLTAEELNASCGVSPAQASAMFHGSLFGWTTKAADPKTWADRPEQEISDATA